MSCKKIYVGDTFSVGPFYAKLSDGTVLDLTGAMIESACKLATGGAQVFLRENAAAGGGPTQVEVTDLATGAFYVHVDSTTSLLLAADKEYRIDARAKLTGGEVYTVGYVIFRTEAAATPVPA
jgi:hypothetical protein